MYNKAKNILEKAKSKKKEFGILAVVIVILAFLYSSVLPPLININKYKSKIIELCQMDKRIDGKVRLGKLGLELPVTGGIVITLSHVDINHDNGNTILKAKNLKCKIAIIPLLFKDIVIKNVKADDFKLYTMRNEEDRLDVEDVFLPPLPDDEYFIRFRNSKADVHDYHIELMDKVVLPNKKFILDGKKINLINLTENKKIRFKIEGTLNKETPFYLNTYLSLPVKEDLLTNAFHIKGHVENFNLKYLSSYTAFSDTQGFVNSNFNVKLANQKIETNNKVEIVNSILIPEVEMVLTNGKVELKTSYDKNTIDIKKFSSSINNINIDIEGTIKKWSSKNPGFNLKIKSPGFNIRNLYSILPEVPDTEELLTKIDSLNLSGDTKIDLKIKGNLKEPKLFGELKISDYSLTLPNNIIIKDIKSVFNFDNSSVTVKNWLIPLTGTNILQINGKLDFIKKQFQHLNISSTNLDLNNLKNLALALVDLVDQKVLLVGDISSEGYTKVNLDLNGKIESPNIEGNIVVNSKNLNLKGFSRPIESLIADIKFEKAIANIKKLNLNLDPYNKINVQGKYNFQKGISESIKLQSDRLSLNKLQNILMAVTSSLKSPINELKLVDITGNTNFDIDVKGNINNPEPYGQAILSNVKILDKETGIAINNINGQIAFNKSINLNSLSGNIENNPIKISGVGTLNGQGEIRVDIPKFNLNDVRTLALKLNIFKPEEVKLLKEAVLNGSVSGNVGLKVSRNNITPSANIRINDSFITHPILPDRVNINEGTLELVNNSININKLTLITSGSTFNISGNLNNLENIIPKYMIEAKSKNVTYDLIRKVSSHPLAPKGLKELISTIKSTSGNASLSLKANNKDFDINLVLDNIAIHTTELDRPVENISGKIHFSNNILSLSKVTAEYSGSYFIIDGSISNLAKTPFINVNIDGKLTPLSFKEFYVKDVKENLVFSEPIEFRGEAKGNIKNWDIMFVSHIPETSKIELKGVFQKPESIPITLMIDGKGSTEFIDIDKIVFRVGESNFNAKGFLEYSEEDMILIDNLQIKIPGINLDELNGFLAKGLLTDDLSGQIKSNLDISGTAFNPDIEGFINFDKVSLPMINSKDISFNIELLGNEANIQDAHLNVNGIIFEISSHISNFKEFPIELTNLKIHSPSLRLTSLLSTLSSKTQDKKWDSLPIIVKNGILTIDDAIIDKLITSNLKGNITLCPSGLLQINNLSLNTAGGSATGSIYVNLLKDTLGAQLQIVGVKANAAATVLLDLPNEIFGNLNSTVVFSSKGETYDQIIENAEGQASLIISDGRFSRLGTLEHLLTATNIIGGGVTGLNLNNILASIIPMHTGAFELLTGDFTVKKGILETDNLISRGKNLSLEIGGNFNIYTEDADLNIKGNLSRNVSGLLGPLGNLNLDTLTDFIPGLGFIPGASKNNRRIGLLDFIPGLGFIPGFGGPKKDSKVRTFAVELQGKLYKMSSVKNFRWTK